MFSRLPRHTGEVPEGRRGKASVTISQVSDLKLSSITVWLSPSLPSPV